MLGLMQDWPLLCTKVLDHAALHHGRREVVSRSVEGPIHRTTYAAVRERALRLARRLDMEGIGRGERVATMAWNTWRHLECWYGILGVGAVYHTLNPRLFPDQIAWIMNDAEDRMIFADLTFIPILEAIAPRVPSLRKIVVLTDAAHLPDSTLDLVAYEDWLDEADADFRWVEVDERDAAGMCYTSGTTGNPKGVVYSHRSNILHSFIAIQPDAMNLSSPSRVMPVVPLFHANGWGIAFSCPMVGATMVLPGPKMDGASICELLVGERVTFSAAVPTVWLMLLQHLQASGALLPDLQRVVIGGAACPRIVTETFETLYGVEVVHAWGMTETSPLGTLNVARPETAGQTGEALFDRKQKQGQVPFGVEMKVTDDENRELPRDGKTFGRLKVRGPAVSSAYHRGTGGEAFDTDGWFDTGDVAHIDENGTMQITDRAKDVIKSGGEWISSIDLENLAVSHPDVLEAAVIGIAHPKWDERPLLVVVRRPESALTREAMLDFMAGKVARWWMPDDVAFVDEIPHTATGKIQKMALRRQFEAYRLPGVEALSGDTRV
ncbi:long-chain-fatty-acid--CoA ligase [Aureimonas pseudogalii]|uniref:3-methylmercaptopropionyl-CoA ligase n=1 Tax=Aureimonas pseudogalii TaxID=1744844 RepID=A0A7W6MK43_9HYPH|nr:long-chain-fatty-acid--CoA ligase [Aureimonas pseudogalii]MBB3998804.1 fatty-acyl-CoA synthase [Aureimonas pseudogalii]